ncbi:MAG TPA: CRISPR-associated endonuclease Cas2 [Candidatus Obscuribacterales bacterium]
MRRCYLVSYDIRHPRRLRRVYKVLRGYGEHWQYSVFFCVLRDIDRVRLQAALEKEMNLKEDQALIVDLGSNEDNARESAVTIGQSLPQPELGMMVV